MWRDREGNKVTAKEFMQRWKGGIEKVTAQQKVKMQIIFTIIILLGVLIGIVTAILTKIWWLLIVLVGAFGINVISFIGILQQYIAYDKIEKALKGGENGI